MAGSVAGHNAGREKISNEKGVSTSEKKNQNPRSGQPGGIACLDQDGRHTFLVPDDLHCRVYSPTHLSLSDQYDSAF
jgi:hypothetical protein